jgi:multisubunit Na+/H+ antiporter MnhG subunit
MQKLSDNMNKIIFRFGLLVFFLSVIYFGQKNIPLTEILIRSFVIFVFITSMASMLYLLLTKSARKNLSKKNKKKLADNLTGE